MPFCSWSCQLPLSWMISLLSWINIGLILCSLPLLDSNPLHQRVLQSKQDDVSTVTAMSVWLASALVLLLQCCFLHSSHLYKQVGNRCEWDSKNWLGLLISSIWWSWAVLNCWNSLLLQKIYVEGDRVATHVRLFD